MNRQNTCQVRDLAVCCVPKNASTALKYALLESQGIRPDSYRGNPHHHPALGRRLPEQARGFIVTFLRDPVDRAVSAWRNKLDRDTAPPSTAAMLEAGFRLRMSLDEFVEVLPAAMDLDGHTAPQHCFLPERVDFIGRVEALSDGWAFLRRRFPWLAPIRVLNASNPPAVPAEIRQRLEELYAEDLALWKSAGAP